MTDQNMTIAKSENQEVYLSDPETYEADLKVADGFELIEDILFVRLLSSSEESDSQAVHWHTLSNFMVDDLLNLMSDCFS